MPAHVDTLYYFLPSFPVNLQLLEEFWDQKGKRVLKTIVELAV